MKAILFTHGKAGGFKDKDDLRRQLSEDFRKDGIYFLPKLFDVPADSLAFFEMENAIVGCAVVQGKADKMTEIEQAKYGDEGGWRKAAMTLAGC